MAPRLRTWVVTGALALAALGPAAAQRVPAPGWQSIAPYTGVLTPFGYQQPWVPSDWISPHTVISSPWGLGVYGPFGGFGGGGQRIPALAGALSMRPYDVAAGALGLVPYTGMTTAYGYQAPSIASDQIIPHSYVTYSAPQVVYVPVAVAPEQPDRRARVIVEEQTTH